MKYKNLDLKRIDFMERTENAVEVVIIFHFIMKILISLDLNIEKMTVLFLA